MSMSQSSQEDLLARIAGLEEEVARQKQEQARLQALVEQLRALAVLTRALSEKEQARIARILHDEIGQSLTGLKMDVLWLQNYLRDFEQPVLDRHQKMVQLIDAAVQTVRRISNDLRPGILDNFGLVAAVEWQLQRFSRQTRMRSTFTCNVDETAVKEEAAVTVFRIFQAMLLMIAAQATASRVEVSIEESHQRFVLQVKDNGRGARRTDLNREESLALLNMQEQAHSYGGEVELSGKLGRGTTFLLNLPLPAQFSASSRPSSEVAF
jgi:two-component system, NarL family, sensor histidine kinase UhpB